MNTTRTRNLLAAALAPAHAADKKPNILFILVDNLGYGEVGATAAASRAAR